MSVEGLCQYCENARANHRCEGCGALVCNAHYDRQKGSCVRCSGVGLR